MIFFIRRSDDCESEITQARVERIHHLLSAMVDLHPMECSQCDEEHAIFCEEMTWLINTEVRWACRLSAMRRNVRP